MTNPFAVFATSDISIRKANGTIIEQLKASVANNCIEVFYQTLIVDVGDIAIRHLPNGQQEAYEVKHVVYKDALAGIPDSIELKCVKINQTMSSFGSHQHAIIVRARGTSEEKTWETQMSGDLSREALFYPADRVKTGDEIQSEVFDEPRIITRVAPSLLLDGSVSHWKAEIIPQSEWQRLHRQPMPNINVSGQGARVNVGSADHSVQQFHNVEAEHVAVLRVLDEIKAAIQQSGHPADVRKDATLDVEQLKTELQRSKPDKNLISTLVQRITALAGLATAIDKLLPLLQHLGWVPKP